MIYHSPGTRMLKELSFTNQEPVKDQFKPPL